MLNTIIKICLRNRALSLIFAGILSILGLYSASQLPIDVIPDVSRPRVTVFAEVDGWAPEEMETLITFPIERSINGAPGIVSVRSSSAIGLSVINAEFDWGTDITKARQIITERLQTVTLPESAHTSLGPNATLMGEIVWGSVTAKDGNGDPKELRSVAEWLIKPRLLSIPGVSNVLIMGGVSKQYQVMLRPELLRVHNISIEEVIGALEQVNENKSGGFIIEGNRELPVRILARTTLLEDLKKTVIKSKIIGDTKQVVSLGDIANLTLAGEANPRGSALVNGETGVILRIVKQNDADTLSLTKEIDGVFRELEQSVPSNIVLSSSVFRQEWFIRSGLSNVSEALRDSAIVVMVIVTLFLMNVRTTAISLISVPLSILTSFIIFFLLGIGINVMTLGGLVVAIGELVDDAIVDVENVFRRLRENALVSNDKRKNALKIIFEASSEVRGSIIYATLLVIIVFLPLLFLPGVEGKLIAPIGQAYIISLLSSLVISLTVVPVLCSYFLPGYIEKHARKYAQVNNHVPGFEPDDTWLMRKMKNASLPMIGLSIRYSRIVFFAALITLPITGILYFFAGKEGIPSFSEPTYTAMIATPVGSSLEYTKSVAEQIGKSIAQIPGITHYATTLGRADSDAHASGVNSAELEIAFDTKNYTKDTIEKGIQNIFDSYEGKVLFSLGQPITHRMQELVSGSRAPIVLKLYGPELEVLESQGAKIAEVMKLVPGTTNVFLEQQVKVPQITLTANRDTALNSGIELGQVHKSLEDGLLGKKIGDILDGNRLYPLVVMMDPTSKGDASAIGNLLIPVENQPEITVSSLASVQSVRGYNSVNHENGQRRITITSGISGRDVTSIVNDIQTRVKSLQLPPGYYISYEGDYLSQKEATKRLSVIALIVFAGVMLVLFWHFKSLVLVGQIMLSIFVAFLGGMIAVWATGGVISTPHLIGFISLIGIVSRNGIMLISHYIHLIKHEGMSWSEELVIRGSLERVTPVAMTAFCSAFALLPLMLGGDATGKEFLAPLATVIFGGLMLSTLLELLVRPGIFYQLSQKSIENILHSKHEV